MINGLSDEFNIFIYRLVINKNRIIIPQESV